MKKPALRQVFSYLKSFKTNDHPQNSEVSLSDWVLLPLLF